LQLLILIGITYNGWGCAQWGRTEPADLSPAKDFVASPIAPNI